MSVNTLNFNPRIANPNLATLLNEYRKNILLSINCHAIATVQDVDYDTQTLTAQIQYTSTWFQKTESQSTFEQQETNYPILINVPFVILGGGAATVTFPIAKGDQALLLFNDRDIDNWSVDPAAGGPVNSNRLHSMSDAIALVGLKMNGTIDPDRAVIRNGNALVGVGGGSGELVKIANEITTLKTILDNLVSAINGMTVTVPSTPGTFPVSGVTGITSQIASLLE